MLAASTACSTEGGVLDYGACPEGYLSECAHLDVPLDHEGNSSERISVHIARHPAKNGATKQLWLLAGGPGQAGDAYTKMIPKLHEALPDTDVYVMDHRGTGYSHRLLCTAFENGTSIDTAKACLAELEEKGEKQRLDYFTITQAARDLVSAIEATRSDRQQVFLWGSSYGTVWAHRTAQIAPPGLLSGVVFDGFLSPNKASVIEYDHGIEEVGQRLAVACAEDAECRSHIGADPIAATRSLYARLNASPCMSFDGDAARAFFGRLIDVQYLSVVFPAMVRLSRCSASDQSELTSFMSLFDERVTRWSTRASTFSRVLNLNISISELWSVAGTPSVSAEELQSRADAQTFSLGGDSIPGKLARIRSIWPLPPVPSSVSEPVGDKGVAMLWLAGTMDTRTPLDQARKVTQMYPASSFVVVPHAGHVPSGHPAGYGLVVDFLRTREVNRRWLRDPDDAPVRFQDPEAINATWGTTEQWGAGSPSLP